MMTNTNPERAAAFLAAELLLVLSSAAGHAGGGTLYTVSSIFDWSDAARLAAASGLGTAVTAMGTAAAAAAVAAPSFFMGGLEVSPAVQSDGLTRVCEAPPSL